MSTPGRLFSDAEYWAKQRAMWRTLADLRHDHPSNLHHPTRRQCLHQARQAEAKIVNLAIRAERDADIRSTDT